MTVIDVDLVTAYTFTGLDPATAYTAEVRARNDAGASGWVPAPFATAPPPPPSGTAGALEGLAVELRAAGLNAYIDAADVSPPGVVIRADAEQPGSAKLCGGYPVRVTLWCVVPDTTTLAAYRAIDELRDRVLPALEAGSAVATADDRTYERLVMPDDPTGLPALRIPVRLIVPATAPTGRNKQ